MKLIYNTDTQKLLPWPRTDEQPVVGLAPNLLEMTVIQEQQPAYDSATQRLEKTEVIDTNAQTVTRGWNVVAIPATTYTAEEWLTIESFTPLRLLTCLDLEAKLNAQQKVSAKMQAVRQWLDGVTLTAAPDPDSPRSDWPTAPYTFADASSEALQVLAS